MIVKIKFNRNRKKPDAPAVVHYVEAHQVIQGNDLTEVIGVDARVHCYSHHDYDHVYLLSPQGDTAQSWAGVDPIEENAS